MQDYQTELIIKDFTSEGMPKKLAEKVAFAIRANSTIQDLSHLATKDDLRELKAEIKGDISSIRSEFKEFKEEIKALKTSVMKTVIYGLITIVLFFIGATFWLTKLLITHPSIIEMLIKS
jgi:HAMP domain-containing protein